MNSIKVIDSVHKTNHECPHSRMSIKDRIRAMNLDAGLRNSVQTKPINSIHRTRLGELPSSAFRFSTGCDLSTLSSAKSRQKPSGLMSDPGVGIDTKTVSAAINMWHKRASEDKTEEKSKFHQQGSCNKTDIENEKPKDHEKVSPFFITQRSPNSILRRQIQNVNEIGLIAPKLKPVHRAPETLKIILSTTERRSKESAEEVIVAVDESTSRIESNPWKKRQQNTHRNKISDRIKVYNSGKYCGNWKPVAPPGSLQQKSVHNSRSLHPFEDASCDSSEKQSLDEDSISNCTPRHSGNLTRQVTLPPTPSSHISDSGYTIASSGDGAVVGSVGSSQQMNPVETRYSAMSTPEASITGNDDSSVNSSKHQQINIARSHGSQPPSGLRPVMKNSLQSKLEYDKARAIRRSMMLRKQSKVPNTHVAAQKKIVDSSVKPVWDHSSIEKTIDELNGGTCNMDTFLTSTVRSHLPSFSQRIDRNRELQSQIPQFLDAPDDEAEDIRSEFETKMMAQSQQDSFAKLNACEEHQIRSKSVDKISMKADAMKEIIRRRRRRKEFQASKVEIFAKNDSITAASHVIATQNDQGSDDSQVPRDKTDIQCPPYIKRALENVEISYNFSKDKSILSDKNVTPFDSTPMTSKTFDKSDSKTERLEDHSSDECISVASSLILEETSAAGDGDEPDPVVDSFTIELSPIRSQDVSKHIFDTSTIYQGSPSSYTSRNQEDYASFPERISNVVPPLTASTSVIAEFIADKHINEASKYAITSSVVMPETNLDKHPPMHSSSSTNISKSPLVESLSEASSGLSSISGIINTKSSKANKILSERRNKVISDGQSHSADEKVENATEASAIGINLKTKSNDETDAIELRCDDRIHREDKNHFNRIPCIHLERCSNIREVSEPVQNSLLIMDQSFISANEGSINPLPHNISTSADTGWDANCFKYSFLHMDKIPNISEMCGDRNKLEFSNSSDASTISAVRISQNSEDIGVSNDEDMAIEVEFISDEDIESLSNCVSEKAEIMTCISIENPDYAESRKRSAGIGPDGLFENEHRNYVSDSSIENDLSSETSYVALQTEIRS